MATRITFDLVQRDGLHSVAVRGLWQPFATQATIGRSLARTVRLPADCTLGEQEMWELAGAIEQEIMGWPAKLPLGYAD